jgi:hypothetical protein
MIFRQYAIGQTVTVCNHNFTEAERERLVIYREAVRAGFYNDGGPVTNYLLPSKVLRGWA